LDFYMCLQFQWSIPSSRIGFHSRKKREANGKIAVGNNNTDCQGGFNHFKSEISLWQTWIKWNLMESIYLF
jgi:hypothetical protein